MSADGNPGGREHNGPARKVAFVLSGGGNRGAMEVGAIHALVESGILPQIVVGTSVGAINAAAIAALPTEEGARWLGDIWLGVTRKDVMPTNYLSMVWRFVTGEMGLVTNDKLRNLLASHFPERISTFADIGMVELYITALDLEARRLHVFGVDRSESVLDAIMASCAVPFFLAPWEYRGHQYVDGALLSDLPVRVAIQRGATEIFAIDVGIRRAARWSARGVFRSMGRIMDAVASQQVKGELAWAQNLPDVVTHHVHLDAFLGVRMWDFSRSAEMIEEGKRAGREHLQRWGLA